MSPSRGSGSPDFEAPVAFRLLLLLYPPRFRRRHAAALAEAFRAERDARRRGAARFWLWLIRDALSAAAWLRFRSSETAPAPPRDPRPRGSEMLLRLLSEVRQALRSLRATPGFTVVAILILAVGIGSITVVFAVMNAIFLQDPARIRAPGELVRLTTVVPSGVSGAFEYPDYVFYRESSRTLSGIIAFDDGATVAVLERSAGERESVEVRLVSGNYFDVLGIPMAVGRTLAPEDLAAPDEGAAVVLEHGFWSTAFGGDPAVVGETIRLNGASFRIVGVAAAGFRGAGPLDSLPDLWTPLTMQPTLQGSSAGGWITRQAGTSITWLNAIGRLVPGATVAQARAEFDRLSEELVEISPDASPVHVAADFTVSPDQRGRLVETGRLLFGAVGMVLLIVCANVAVLQLARAHVRQREVAIRAAIGAGRGQIVRHVFIESGLVALAGGLLGLAVSVWGAAAVRALLPVQLFVDIHLDLRVLSLTMFTVVCVTLACGLGPALASSRTDVVRAMHSRSLVGGDGRTRAALVVAQVALSVVLLLGAVLFARSLVAARNVDPGFATERVAFVTIRPSSQGYDPQETQALLSQLVERVAADPEVVSAGTSLMTPFRGGWTSTFDPTGAGDEALEVTVTLNAVGPGYFESLGVPLLGGRGFDRTDTAESAPVMVVSRAAARMLFPDTDPLEQTVPVQSAENPHRVVGVAEDADYGELGETPLPVVYVVSSQTPFSSSTLVVAARNGSAEAISATRRQLETLAPGVPVAGARTIEEILTSQVATYRLGAGVVGAFASVAVLLTAIGLYGVLAYLVSRARREIGVRMALGDTRAGIVRRVLSTGMRMAFAGVALGLVGALLLARTIAGMLYGVSAYDPISYVAVPVLLVAITALASGLPARRASGVDPVRALRAD